VVSVPAEGAQFIVNEVVNAAWTASDVLSGIDGVVASTPNQSALATATTGAQTFSVVALDRAGNETTGTRTYQVLSPAQATERLQQAVLASHLQKGIENSLSKKLDAVVKGFASGKPKSASRKLRAFINEVNALAGKKIDAATATALIADATKLIEVGGS
jgi:hypothetical protein